MLFVPGWGTTPQGFLEVIEEIARHGELVYLETREKLSSRMDSSAPFDMDAMAQDVEAAVVRFRLPERHGVLLATCWGSSVVLHARATGLCRLPTVVCHDPMHRIWAPRWLLRFGAPFLPWRLLALLRPLIKPAILHGMEGPVQRRRTEQFIDGADTRKWRRAAVSVQDWSLFPLLSAVPDEVFITNGSGDKIHDASQYPRIAQALPRGRFVFVPAGDSLRERLIGVLGRLFALTAPGVVPPAVAPHVEPTAAAETLPGSG